jgi:hypothetical protein
MLSVSEAVETVARIQALHLADRAALASAAKPRNSEIPPGEYPVDFTVRIVGMVKKGEDYVSTQPQAINPWALCGYLLSKLNATTAASVAQYVAEAYKSGEDFDAYKKYAEAAMETIAEATTTTKSGRTDCVVSVTVIK